MLHQQRLHFYFGLDFYNCIILSNSSIQPGLSADLNTSRVSRSFHTPAGAENGALVSVGTAGGCAFNCIGHAAPL